MFPPRVLSNENQVRYNTDKREKIQIVRVADAAIRLFSDIILSVNIRTAGLHMNVEPLLIFPPRVVSNENRVRYTTDTRKNANRYDFDV